MCVSCCLTSTKSPSPLAYDPPTLHFNRQASDTASPPPPPLPPPPDLPPSSP